MWGPLDVVVGADRVLYLVDQPDGVELWVGTPQALDGA